MEIFTKELLSWYKENKRAMPWVKEKDPYKVWVSEIILQQTQVKQGLEYYTRFLAQYPTVQDLAESKEDEVLKLWQGLGYYSRARNMHTAAKQIVEKYDGNFPSNYIDILSLKGVGQYTAAAIASFAFNLEHAVVDANVIRVITRFKSITSEVHKKESQVKINNYAAKAMKASGNPGLFNQAIMDFGALQCNSKPRCEVCILNVHCAAHKNNIVNLLPNKKKKPPRRNRYFHCYLIVKGKRIAIQKRDGSDIWKHLYELPYIESDSENEPNAEEQLSLIISPSLDKNQELVASHSQILTHQKIHFYFYTTQVKNEDFLKSKHLKFVSIQELGNFAYPAGIKRFLDDYLLNEKLNKLNNFNKKK